MWKCIKVLQQWKYFVHVWKSLVHRDIIHKCKKCTLLTKKAPGCNSRLLNKYNFNVLNEPLPGRLFHGESNIHAAAGWIWIMDIVLLSFLITLVACYSILSYRANQRVFGWFYCLTSNNKYAKVQGLLALQLQSVHLQQNIPQYSQCTNYSNHISGITNCCNT